MDEKEYLDKIDAAFPYEDENAWKAVIDEAVSISPNAAYGALYEIVAAHPEVPLSDIEKMMDYWSARFDHPTKDMVLEMAKAWVWGPRVPDEDVLPAMEMIAQHHRLYMALVVVAGPPLERSTAVDDKYAEIHRNWGYGASRGDSGDSRDQPFV